MDSSASQEVGPVQFDQIFWEVSNTAGTEQQSFQSIPEPISMFQNSCGDADSFFAGRRLSCGGMSLDLNFQGSFREPFDISISSTSHHPFDHGKHISSSSQRALDATVLPGCSAQHQGQQYDSSSAAPFDGKPNLHLGFRQIADFEESAIANGTSMSSTGFTATRNAAQQHQTRGASSNLIAAANASFAATFSDEQLAHLAKQQQQQATRLPVQTSSSLPAVSSSSQGAVATTSTSRVSMTSGERGGKWQQRFGELVEFKNEYEHCSVPTHWPQNHALAQWVKRQRSQYKLKKSGKHSNLSDAREKALDDLGFIWDSHSVFWEERLDELRAFRDEHGHANVPTKYPKNQQLAVWAKCQRRQFKLLVQGNPQSNMTQNRIAKLASVGFIFDPRKSKQKFLSKN